MPPIDCDQRWVRRALEPRHLRALKVGCGESEQCVWLPYPHHIDPWCSAVDFLYDVDYREMVSDNELTGAKRASASTRSLGVGRQWNKTAGRGGGVGGGLFELGGADADDAQVLVLRGTGGRADLLEDIHLGGFRQLEWRAPFARQVDAALRAPPPAGLGLELAQMKVVRDCLKSLATSNE